MNTTTPLSDEVVTALRKCGHKNPTKWQQSLDIIGIAKLPAIVQADLITSHIKQIVAKHDTGNVRQKLNMSDERSNWVNAFEQHVAPLMCANDI